MFEYDEDLKLRSLIFFGFDIENLNIDKINHVPMHQYRIRTKEQPLLYVDNLQVCIGLYAYGNNFGFAAHINPKVMRYDDYELDNSGNPIRCCRIDDLRNIIVEKLSYQESIIIGVSLGIMPLKNSYPTIKMIYDGINDLIRELTSLKIKIEHFEIQYAPEFILDTDSGKIILPKKKQKLKCMKKT